MIRTFCPGATASFWISASAWKSRNDTFVFKTWLVGTTVPDTARFSTFPYSNSYATDAVGPGSLPFFLTWTKPTPSRWASRGPKRKPRASRPARQGEPTGRSQSAPMRIQRRCYGVRHHSDSSVNTRNHDKVAEQNLHLWSLNVHVIFRGGTTSPERLKDSLVLCSVLVR